jgi:hypothetical protein
VVGRSPVGILRNTNRIASAIKIEVPKFDYVLCVLIYRIKMFD